MLRVVPTDPSEGDEATDKTLGVLRRAKDSVSRMVFSRSPNVEGERDGAALCDSSARPQGYAVGYYGEKK